MSRVEAYANRFKHVIGFGEDIKPEEDPTVVLTERTRMAIMVLLAERGPLTVKQISDLLGLSAPAIHKHIHILSRARLVKRVHVESALKIEKYYDIALPFVTDHELKVLFDMFYEQTKEVAEHFKRIYLEVLRRFQEMLPGLKLYKHINTVNPVILKLAIYQLLWSCAMRILTDRGELPSFKEADNKWAGFMVIT